MSLKDKMDKLEPIVRRSSSSGPSLLSTLNVLQIVRTAFSSNVNAVGPRMLGLKAVKPGTRLRSSMSANDIDLLSNLVKSLLECTS